jgi:hypothetical protein
MKILGCSQNIWADGSGCTARAPLASARRFNGAWGENLEVFVVIKGRSSELQTETGRREKFKPFAIHQIHTNLDRLPKQFSLLFQAN